MSVRPLQDMWNEARRNLTAYEESVKGYHRSISQRAEAILYQSRELEAVITSIRAKDPASAERLRMIMRNLRETAEKMMMRFY